MPVLNTEALIEDRVQAIKHYHQKVGTEKAELDLSGGIDSADMCGLLAKALGPKNVICVYSGINSDPASLERATAVADTFGVIFVHIDLTKLYGDLIFTMAERYVAGHTRNVRDPWFGGPGLQGTGKRVREELNRRIHDDPTILGSIRSCIRAPIGRGFNRFFGGGIRHGTGNECEDRWLRFYQKGGDGEVDTNPIAMLSKGEVYQLAVALGVPKEIIDAKPSPDLWGEGEEGHNDEAELLTWAGAPFTYSRVNPDTGEYIQVGTIERVSRFCDTTPGSWLFADQPPHSDDMMPGVIAKAVASPLFAGISADTVGVLLKAARRVERMTRHKWNPNCPSLGTRAELLGADILTNTLPVIDAGDREDSK